MPAAAQVAVPAERLFDDKTYTKVKNGFVGGLISGLVDTITFGKATAVAILAYCGVSAITFITKGKLVDNVILKPLFRPKL